MVAFLFFFIPIVYDSIVLLVYLSINMNKNMGKQNLIPNFLLQFIAHGL